MSEPVFDGLFLESRPFYDDVVFSFEDDAAEDVVFFFEKI